MEDQYTNLLFEQVGPNEWKLQATEEAVVDILAAIRRLRDTRVGARSGKNKTTKLLPRGFMKVNTEDGGSIIVKECEKRQKAPPKSTVKPVIVKPPTPPTTPPPSPPKIVITGAVDYNTYRSIKTVAK